MTEYVYMDTFSLAGEVEVLDTEGCLFKLHRRSIFIALEYEAATWS